MNRAEIKRILRLDDRGMALWALHHILKLEKENRRLRQAVTALRTPHGLPVEEELVLLMRQNLSVDVSNYGLSADIEGIEDAARAILSRLTASREDGKNG